MPVLKTIKIDKKTLILIAIIFVSSLIFAAWRLALKQKIILPEDARYQLNGQTIQIGKQDIFFTPVYSDLDLDGDNDAVLMFTQNPGGSGTFFYVAAAINNKGSFQGTNAVPIGDRIAPQNINFLGTTIVVNYVERKPEEPMTAKPSQDVNKYLIIENGLLQETDQPVG